MSKKTIGLREQCHQLAKRRLASIKANELAEEKKLSAVADLVARKIIKGLAGRLRAAAKMGWDEVSVFTDKGEEGRLLPFVYRNLQSFCRANRLRILTAHRGNLLDGTYNEIKVSLK